ncbi:MAG: hypothetical protein AB1546_04550, partial [bacterium]
MVVACIVYRLRGWNRLSVIVIRVKDRNTNEDYRFERRNRNRIRLFKGEVFFFERQRSPEVHGFYH